MKSPRHVELARIHMMAGELKLDDETYRAMLWTVARVRSAADLDGEGRRAVIAHLRARGASTGPARKRRPTPATHKKRLLKKIDATLIAMGSLPRSYVETGVLPQMFGEQAPARLEWCAPDQLRKVVAALAVHQRRAERQQQRDRDKA